MSCRGCLPKIGEQTIVLVGVKREKVKPILTRSSIVVGHHSLVLPLCRLQEAGAPRLSVNGDYILGSRRFAWNRILTALRRYNTRISKYPYHPEFIIPADNSH